MVINKKYSTNMYFSYVDKKKKNENIKTIDFVELCFNMFV